MSVLYIVRGLPGSGKSTLAKKLVLPIHHKEADMYHTFNGEYNFNPANVKDAHAWCYAEITDIMMQGIYNCAVSNTFTQRWEYERYEDAANALGYDVAVIDCHGPWENTHAVPNAVIARMKKKWEAHKQH